MSELVLYGIPNCNQVKSARVWLEQQRVEYKFHDYKKQGVPQERLTHWLKEAGQEKIVNRKGTTWRTLNDAQRAQCDTAKGAIEVLQTHASLIKRPILENANTLLCIGFDASEYQRLFK